jgi:WD40 repeat protein
LSLVGSGDKTARLWDAATGKPIGAPLQHQSAVKAVTYSPDGKTLLTLIGFGKAAHEAGGLWLAPAPVEGEPKRITSCWRINVRRISEIMSSDSF